jgi:ABC-2 type transport system permease protein
MERLKEIFTNIYRVLIRTLAFTAKELRNIFHQPRLIFSLILGPFLILLIFGVGLTQSIRTLDTLFVVPEDGEIARLLQLNVDNLPTNINYVGTTENALGADDRLRWGDVDLVIVAPAEPAENWRHNSQAKFTFYHNEIDPLEATYVQIVGRRSIDQLNKIVLAEVVNRAKLNAQDYQQDVKVAREQASAARRSLELSNAAEAQDAVTSLQQNIDLLTSTAASGMMLLSLLEPTQVETTEETAAPLLTARLEAIQEDLEILNQIDTNQADFSNEIAAAAKIEADLDNLDTMLTEFQQTDSQILVEPFTDETLAISRMVLNPTHFYVPAVLALLLQHIAITMAALSIVREKQQGTLELFRAAPVSAFETLLGKYIGFFLLNGLIAAALIGLVIFGLGTPMLGNWEQLLVTVIALLIVSMGVGFNLSLSARSDSQAIQYSMIVLLASIFFTGLFVPLYRLQLVALIVAWALPATYAAELLKDIMLRGYLTTSFLLNILLLFSVLLFVLAWWRLYHGMKQD